MSDKLQTVQQVAEDLQIHEKTVRNLIRRGELQAIRIGSQFRVAPRDLERFKDANRYRREEVFSANPHSPAA